MQKLLVKKRVLGLQQKRVHRKNLNYKRKKKIRYKFPIISKLNKYLIKQIQINKLK